MISRKVSRHTHIGGCELTCGIDQCNSAQQSAQVQDFQTGVASTNIGPDPQFPDFDLICEG